VDKIISNIIALARECVEYTGMPQPTKEKITVVWPRIGQGILSRDFLSESLIGIYNYRINESPLLLSIMTMN